MTYFERLHVKTFCHIGLLLAFLCITTLQSPNQCSHGGDPLAILPRLQDDDNGLIQTPTRLGDELIENFEKCR